MKFSPLDLKHLFRQIWSKKVIGNIKKKPGA